MADIQNPNEIYNEIGRLIWSIFPESALEAYFECQIYNCSTGYSFYWLDEDGNDRWHKFGSNPNDILELISKQLELLQQHAMFVREHWTQCRVILTDESKLDIKFAYVKEEDAWSGLYMKGVSELTKEELSRYSVPEDIWAQRKSMP
ncbi:hypothetical protein FG135_17740 [Vibrio cholerae]|uniref:immunity protein YezG family protein n=1 Tax=Vibrio cholerae TaxID=666 RepID=UPI00053BCBF4|nr:hypothetical protein [Vibrio cholerae]EGR0659709.1 hypothetical protein [Vibrio cholerae]EGR1102513.1 hypothetical protein [Vibrio cholerae]EGR4455593.1 hypothetical protein [Vibrio cholerae]EGR5155473.1 hypothetical protein [Vibrio cholerae]EIC9845464.1 hypothetical protein [Vibrio cholerae]